MQQLKHCYLTINALLAGGCVTTVSRHILDHAFDFSFAVICSSYQLCFVSQEY
jgi:hypothetical protein